MRAAPLFSPALFGAALLLAGCGSNDTDSGPGGVTVAEAKALDEAAEMIEARRLPPEALEEGAPSTADAATAPTATESAQAPAE